MEHVACNCCGSARYRVVYRKPDQFFFPEEYFQVVECLECGLGYVNPRPTFEEIGKYYPKAFFDEFAENKMLHLRRYAAEAGYLAEIERRKKSRRMLDVGCANGDFPRFMRGRGWDVEGVEVADSAHQINDFPVYQMWFPDIPVTTPTYDAVTAWAVLEHVHDPAAYFQKAAQVVCPGGLFVFLVTNFASITSRYLFGEDVPRHLYFFTEQTVRRYLEQAGFTLERADHSKKIYRMPPRYWLNHLFCRLTRRTLTWPTPGTYSDFVERHRLRRGPASFLRFTLTHPVTVADRLLTPFVEQWQLWRKTYGIVIYVGRKR